MEASNHTTMTIIDLPVLFNDNVLALGAIHSAALPDMPQSVQVVLYNHCSHHKRVFGDKGGIMLVLMNRNLTTWPYGVYSPYHSDHEKHIIHNKRSQGMSKVCSLTMFSSWCC
jgi:hypothetical protein